LNAIFSELTTKEEQLVYLSEVITFLINVDIENEKTFISGRMPERSYLAYKIQTNMAKRFFFKQASRINYNFDANAFTSEEVTDLDQKINLVLSEREVIKSGQAAANDEIQELKNELTSLKSAYILGKKTWKQKATGIVVSYLATKGSDAGWEAIKPYMKDFIVHQAPDIIHKLLL
jgi:hypothetical protein